MAQRVIDEQTELEQIEERPALGWLDEIMTSRDFHQEWRVRASDCEEIYRNEAYDVEKFNVLWSNTEILRPILFSDVPLAEASPWSDTPDLAVNTTAKILEKTINKCNAANEYNLGKQGKKVMIDYLVAGRGQARVMYDAEIEKTENGYDVDPETGESTPVYEEKKLSERVYVKHYNWRNFLHSRSKQWENVWYVAFGHDMNRDDLVETFGEAGRDVPLAGSFSRDDYKCWREDANTISRFKANFAKVWEIWSKRDKEVIYISEGYDKVLKREDDPYELKDFYPCPEPLYSVFTTNSLVPIPEFTQYQYQARELDILTRRINWLTDALRVRGIGDSSVKSLKKLFTAEDNEVILDDDYARLAQAGGIENAVTWAPLAQIAQALEVLVKRRQDALQVVYQITGLSDIMSGANNPYESAEAVQKKDKWGSTRIWDRQKDVNRFFRDLVSLEGELIADKFDPATLLVTSGVEQNELTAAGMDQIKQLLESDRLRDYTITIQTDKTLDPYERERRMEIMEFMPQLATFLQATSMAVEAGVLTTDTVHEFVRAFVQRYDFGRDNMYIIEEALSQSKKQSAQKQEMQQQILQAEMQFKMKQVEAQMLLAKAEMAKAQVNAKRYEMENQVELERLKVEWAKLSNEITSDQADRQIRLLETTIKSQTAIEQVRMSREDQGKDTADA